MLTHPCVVSRNKAGPCTEEFVPKEEGELQAVFVVIDDKDKLNTYDRCSSFYRSIIRSDHLRQQHAAHARKRNKGTPNTVDAFSQTSHMPSIHRIFRLDPGAISTQQCIIAHPTSLLFYILFFIGLPSRRPLLLSQSRIRGWKEAINLSQSLTILLGSQLCGLLFCCSSCHGVHVLA